MAVSSIMGVIRDVDKTIDVVHMLTGKGLTIDELVGYIGRVQDIEYFNSSFELTDSLQGARFKIGKLPGMLDKRGNQLYISAARVGSHTSVGIETATESEASASTSSPSSFTAPPSTSVSLPSSYSPPYSSCPSSATVSTSSNNWGAIYIGRKEFLLSKWVKYSNRNIADDKIKDYVMGMADGVGTDVVVEGTGQHKVAVNGKRQSIFRDEFLENVYDLLYDKENWRGTDGNLSRLCKYFKYLLLKVLNCGNHTPYIRYNKNGDAVMFNSRLISKFRSCIIVACRIRDNILSDFEVINGELDMHLKGFTGDCFNVRPVSFFNKLSDVVFDGNIKDFDINNLYYLNHIIEERKLRLPDELRNLGTLDIAIRITSSVEMALRMAEVDYKFIVPMYNEEKNKIQFLVPLYISFELGSKPECALVVDKNQIGRWEIKTVLDLDKAFNNARLVNKLGASWLV